MGSWLTYWALWWTLLRCFSITVITMVYGKNKLEERRGLWNHLLTICRAVRNTPWLILGDFNILRYSSERLGSVDFDHGTMEEFNDWINELDIEECPGKDFYYTWYNKRGRQTRRYSRIDRAFGYDAWLRKFFGFDVEFLAPGISDHSLVSVTLENKINFGPLPFKFHSY